MKKIPVKYRIFWRFLAMICLVGVLSWLLLVRAVPVLATGKLKDPGGSVSGLPTGLTILDSDGRVVPENGIYYFEVEGMNPGEVYTKTIQLMNLRTDGKAYELYFYIEPVANIDNGIDLLENCSQTISLGGDRIYEGNIWGIGQVHGAVANGGKTTTDTTTGLQTVGPSNPCYLGYYKMGESRIMSVSISWNGETGSGDNIQVDNGHRIYDKDHPEGLVIKNGQAINGNGQVFASLSEDGTVSISGENLFRWVFYAEVKDGEKEGGSGNGDKVPLILMLVILGLSGMSLLLMILLKRREQKKKENAGIRTAKDEKNIEGGPPAS